MTGFNWIEDLPAEVLSAVLAKTRQKTLPDGVTIYGQGDRVLEVFQIVTGEIRQCIFTEDGQEVLFYIYKPGDLVCDSAIEEDEPYAATITTRGETRLRVWSAKELRELRALYPEVEAAISAQLSRRLRGAVRLIGELLTQCVAARIASRLCWLNELEGGRALTISQSDIGLMVGTTRQSVNLVMKDMKERGLIEARYGRILVRDALGVRSYASQFRR